MENTTNINKTIKKRDEIVKEVINAGKSIVDNAESIVGNEPYFIKTKVSFIIDRNSNNVPSIEINREFIAENTILEMTKDAKNTNNTKG